MTVVVTVLTNTPTILAALLAAPFVLLPLDMAVAAFAVAWSLYGLTYLSRPEKTYVACRGTWRARRRGSPARGTVSPSLCGPLTCRRPAPPPPPRLP